MLFVESRAFSMRLGELMSDTAYRALQNTLLDNPRAGAVMPGCGGLRKIRASQELRGVGKRGGIRVIYLYIPEARRIDLLAAYSKNEKDDLTPQEQKALASLARAARTEARARIETEDDDDTDAGG
ncbi:MAG: type II toxin-antitoxin system RelE/ParE family toxin [Thermoleophilia bacterium]